MATRIRQRRNRLKRLYIRLLLRLLSRAIPASAEIVPAVREEAGRFPAGCRIRLGVWPDGPDLGLVADGEGGLAAVAAGEAADLDIRLKSVAAAFRLFTFRESTAGSEAAGRLIAAGELPLVLGFIRIIDSVETLLLPGFLARRAVKQPEYTRGFHRRRRRLYSALFLPRRKETARNE